MLIDSFGRVHDSCRISVTDRCNIRCFYCMPNENIQFLPKSELLTFEEITRFARVLAELGVTKIRLTGGEPLVRKDLHRLIEMLREIPEIVDFALTTNGILLDDQARSLKDAGLMRLNVSLDSLRPEVFRQISRRDGLEKVLRGIERAKQVGFKNIRINAVSIAGLTELDVVPLATFCRQHGHHLRFIEFMPLDAQQEWTNEQVLNGRRVREQIASVFGNLKEVERDDPSQPAVDFAYADGQGRVGFINPVSEPFCHACNRLRITAEGQVRNCLFSTVEYDARELLRSGASDDDIKTLISDCVAAKAAGHGINDPKFVRPQKAMYQIGG